MRNLLDDYLKTRNITMSEFARTLKSTPASVHKWRAGTVIPRPEMAWKMHCKTKGAIPITFWGYVVVNGKIRKMNDLSSENKSVPNE